MKKFLLAALLLSMTSASVFAETEEVTTKTVDEIVEMATTALTVAATQIAEEVETTEAAPVETEEVEATKKAPVEVTEVAEVAPTEETAAE
jgi:hypothetical protein